MAIIAPYFFFLVYACVFFYFLVFCTTIIMGAINRRLYILFAVNKLIIIRKMVQVRMTRDNIYLVISGT